MSNKKIIFKFTDIWKRVNFKISITLTSLLLSKGKLKFYWKKYLYLLTTFSQLWTLWQGWKPPCLQTLGFEGYTTWSSTRYWATTAFQTCWSFTANPNCFPHLIFIHGTRSCKKSFGVNVNFRNISTWNKYIANVTKEIVLLFHAWMWRYWIKYSTLNKKYIFSFFKIPTAFSKL